MHTSCHDAVLGDVHTLSGNDRRCTFVLHLEADSPVELLGGFAAVLFKRVTPTASHHAICTTPAFAG